MSDAKPTRESLSKTPSWVMLGFVIGCIVMWTIKTESPAPAPVRPQPTTSAPSTPPTFQAPPEKEDKPDASLSDMEAVFDRWKGDAIWHHDLTEVAFWNRTTNKYDNFVEVLRNGDDYYFRTIPKLTQNLIEAGVPHDAPIKFTEPDSVRAERQSLYLTPAH